MSIVGTAVSRLVSLVPPVDLTSLNVGWGGTYSALPLRVTEF